LNGSHPPGGARQNHVPRQQRHVGRDETHHLETLEDELAGVRVLPELAVLKKLNRQIMRVDFGFNIRP
jgi:hypothetical protein